MNNTCFKFRDCIDKGNNNIFWISRFDSSQECVYINCPLPNATINKNMMKGVQSYLGSQHQRINDRAPTDALYLDQLCSNYTSK